MFALSQLEASSMRMVLSDHSANLALSFIPRGAAMESLAYSAISAHHRRSGRASVPIVSLRENGGSCREIGRKRSSMPLTRERLLELPLRLLAPARHGVVVKAARISSGEQASTSMTAWPEILSIVISVS
mmetsp:Transcript_115961/g.223607  ORF Transcript_115961/g.223607 Transcript_115961/m.223607 type:complete len:130 (+) Transcript_115961:594-983(+)